MRATLTGRLGVVGGLSLALFFAWPSTPAIASPSCTPTANGQSGSSSRTNASGTQYCTSGDTGIYYQAVGGDLTVNLNNDPITGHAININDDSVGRSITVNNGLAGENYAATPIVATDSSKYAVNLQSSGGNLQFTSLSGGSVTFAGSGTAGAAISARTSGAGTIAITTEDTVTDRSGNGITAEGSNGAIAIATYGKLTAGVDGIYASSASGAISLTANGGISAANGIIADSTSGGNINVAAAGAAIDASGTGIDTSGSGNTAVALYGGNITALGGFGIESEATGTGTLSLATAAGTTITAAEAGLYASSDSGSIYISASGTISSPSTAIDAASGSGPITVVTGAGSKTTSTANDGIYANSVSGPVTVVADGNVTALDSPILAYSGGGSAVSVYAGAPSAPVNLVSTASSTWNTIALSNGGNVDITDYGTVKGGLYAQTTGAGTATVYTGPGSSLTTTGTPATSSGDGIDAFGVSGAVFVAANGNITANQHGIDARTGGTANATVVLDGAGNSASIAAPIGIYVFSANGFATITTGSGDAIAAAQSDGANGLWAVSSLAPGAAQSSTSVSLGANNTFNITSDDGTAVNTFNGGGGLGGVSVQTGTGDNFTLTGNSVAGIFASTINYGTYEAGSALGPGSAIVRIGADNNLQIKPGTDQGGNTPLSAGIFALSAGGNIDVEWTGAGGNITASGQSGTNTFGILAATFVPGATSLPTGDNSTLNVATGSGTTIVSNNGFGVFAGNGGTGATTVTINGPVTAAFPGMQVVYPSDHTYVGYLLPENIGQGLISQVTYGLIVFHNMPLGYTVMNGSLFEPPAGIFASGFGAVSVISYAPIVSSNASGIDAYSLSTGSGAVTVNAYANISAAYSPIYASTYEGDANIYIGGPSTPVALASTYGYSSVATSSNGNARISQFGTVVGGLDAEGVNSFVGAGIGSSITGFVRAVGLNGSATAEVNGNVSDSVYHGLAILAAAFSNGNSIVNLDSAGNGVTVSGGDRGIYASSIWGLSEVYVGNNDSINANIGISAQSLGAGVVVTTGTNDIIESPASMPEDGVGLDVSDFGGVQGSNVSITTGTGGLISAGNVGIQVHSAGDVHVTSNTNISAGAYAIYALGNKAISIAVDAGKLTVPGSAQGAVYAHSTGGGAVSFYLGSAAAIDPGVMGIDAATTGSGTIDIMTDTGSSTASDSGSAISAVADSGAITITTAGNVTSASGSAIAAGAASGGITIANSAVLTGGGTAANPVVSLSTAGATSIVNSASGTIQSNQGAPGDLLVAAASGTGAVNISNAGTMTGRVDLSNASAATLDNTGTWNTSGTSNFGAGNSTLNNGGKIVTTGATTFAFAGSGNSFKNNGTLEVGGSIAFENVQTFSNTGTLVVSHPAGTAGVITIPGVFAGGTDSGLTINAFLGTTGSRATCGALADCLEIRGSTGTTELLVKDTGTISDAGVNNTGVLVVSGASAAGDFVLDSKSPGYNPKSRSIDVGFFTYGLGYDPSDQQVRLYGQPNALAYQLPEIVTAAQTLWYATLPSQERQTDLGGAIGPDGSGNVTTGVWMKSVGSFAHRITHAAISFGGTTEALDTSYGEDSYGFVIGVDSGRRAVWLNGDMLLGGFMAGYVGSQVDFRGTPTTASLEGPLVGAYLTYLDDGLSVDVSFKADFLRIQYAETSGAIFAAPSSETSFGAEIDAGKRLPIADALYVEPLASLSWMESTADGAAAFGTTVRFGQNANSRGSAGLRTGALVVSSDGTTFDVSLAARVWDSFAGTNNVTALSPGVPATLSDRFGGAFGEVSADINVFGADNGWSGFLNAGMQFKDRFTSLALAAGARYRW